MYNTQINQGEKRMRVRSLLTAAVLGATSLSASAKIYQMEDNNHVVVPGAFVSEVVTPGTGDFAGMDIHRFFYSFNDQSPPGTAGAVALQSAKVILDAPGAGYKFLTGQFAPPNSGAANPDIDLFGKQNDDTMARTGTTGSEVGTGVFIHDPDLDEWSVQGLFADGVSQTLARQNSTATFNPTQFWGGTKQIRVEGFVTNPPGGVGGDPAAKTATAGTEGAGALFAVAVVPTGSSVGLAQASLSANAGPVLNAVIPEPTTLGFIGLAGIALAGRRRKA
jgi:hypothetical protein